MLSAFQSASHCCQQDVRATYRLLCQRTILTRTTHTNDLPGSLFVPVLYQPIEEIRTQMQVLLQVIWTADSLPVLLYMMLRRVDRAHRVTGACFIAVPGMKQILSFSLDTPILRGSLQIPVRTIQNLGKDLRKTKLIRSAASRNLLAHYTFFFNQPPLVQIESLCSYLTTEPDSPHILAISFSASSCSS